MEEEADFVWVHLDVLRAHQSVIYRGRLTAADFEAITSGGFTPTFVRLDHVHWVESTWDQKDERFEIKVTAFGRDGTWCHCAGPIFLRPDSIAAITPLHSRYGEDYRRGTMAMPRRPARQQEDESDG